MPALLYIHGFLSSPASLKARQMGQWLADNRPEWRYLCPSLTPYPRETRGTLDKLVQEHVSGGIFLMGSSLGGWWATWLAEKYDLKAVLINPVVDLSLFGKYLNVPLRNYHTTDSYMLSDTDAAEFRSLDITQVRRPQNYFLMVQKGDTDLDYRLAVKKYAGGRQLIEEGGNHTFVDFESHIPAAMEFLEDN